MGSDPVELARVVLGAFNEGGVEAMVEHVDSEFEGIVPPDVALEPDTYRGHDGVRRYFAAWEEGIEDLRIEEMDWRVAGGAAVIQSRFTGRGRESGVEAELIANSVLRFRDDKLVRMSAYPSIEEAVAVAEAGGP